MIRERVFQRSQGRVVVVPQWAVGSESLRGQREGGEARQGGGGGT